VLSKRKNYRIPVLLVIIGLFGYIAITRLLPYAIIKPISTFKKLHPKELALKYRPVSIHTAKNVVLKGYRIYTNTENPKGLMILVHGIGSGKEHYLGVAKKLADKGIESIVFDGRAHGESTGAYCTFGYYEKQDVARIIDYIRSSSPTLKIGIWGNSMGGAIALQAMELDNRISFGIIESTFTDLSQIVYDYKKRYLLGFGVRSLSEMALQRAGEIAGFNPKLVRPLAAVQNIEQPVLISHGDADRNINFNYGKQLFANLCSDNKEFIKVKGAGHYNLALKGGETYTRNIFEFITTNLR
jgi:alpha-beta hydrolase superfamily lysophospholipase